MDQPPAVDDADIALLMMDRDQEGLRLLLRKYGGRIKAYVRKHFGDALAEPERKEALNVAAFNVWRFASRYDESKGTLGSWFIRIAQRAAQSILRKEERHRHKELEYEPSYDPAGPEEQEECDIPDRQKERMLTDLMTAIDRLHPLQQAIIKADLAAGNDGPANAARLAQLHGTTKSSIYASRNYAKMNLHKEMLRLGHIQNTRAKR